MDLNSEYLRFVLALILVIGLILLLAWALRRFGFGGMVRAGAKRRLQVLETLPIDPRHRLVLVRRDDTEHLLMLGPTNDLVIEAGIGAADQPTRGPAARFEQTLAQEQRALDLPTLRAERPLGDATHPSAARPHADRPNPDRPHPAQPRELGRENRGER